MKFIDFLDHIKNGECYNLAIGYALREGDAREIEEAKKQVAAHTKQGLMVMAEEFNIFVDTQSFRVPEGYPQIRVTDTSFLRVIEVTHGTIPLQPYSVQGTDTWDYKILAHGLLVFNPRWQNKAVQVLFRKCPVENIFDETDLPTPLINALTAFVAHRLNGGTGTRDVNEGSMYYARFRDAMGLLELAGYSSLRDMPAKNVHSKGFV